jgi:hypothetical protein
MKENIKKWKKIFITLGIILTFGLALFYWTLLKAGSTIEEEYTP